MSTPSDTFSGIRIHAGPFSENGKTVYYYELRFIDNDGPALTIEAQERRKIKFQANVTRAYAGEKPTRFAPNEYRCLFRAPLPAEPYPGRPDQAESVAITAAVTERARQVSPGIQEGSCLRRPTPISIATQEWHTRRCVEARRQP